jgi:hypothetical protein
MGTLNNFLSLESELTIEQLDHWTRVTPTAEDARDASDVEAETVAQTIKVG